MKENKIYPGSWSKMTWKGYEVYIKNMPVENQRHIFMNWKFICFLCKFVLEKKRKEME